ncbi:class I SAM-dependent methyltransferase [Martelella sp. HB161492]|uniref:class I SAM-dependent methyltransferase n=1 Tax=Martelella sp. HB161492 TaxID=2720726 RepID=UPI001FEDD388|nr:class I SAM-dependent methyltransferase [Martelella sp. HB161492]
MSGAATSHAAAMDAMYRYQRHIYDLTRKYYLFGRDRMIDGLAVKPGMSLLELGCGTGRNLKRASQRFPDAALFGLDISEEMLASARRSFRRDSRMPLFKAGDATAFQPGDFDRSGFDRIMIAYALSMIPDWELAIERGMEALQPGGALHIVDFGQQEQLPRWFHHGLTAWLDKFHVTPRHNLEAVLEQVARRHLASLEFRSINRGYAWLAVLRLPAP